MLRRITFMQWPYLIIFLIGSCWQLYLATPHIEVILSLLLILTGILGLKTFEEE